MSGKAYNPLMRRCVFVFLLPVLLAAKEKTLTPGRAENGSVTINATAILDRDSIKQAVGGDLGGYYTLVQVTVTPKSGKVDVHRDDFLLRTDKDGEHTKPLAPSELAGPADLVLKEVQTGGTVGTGRTGPVWGDPSIGGGPIQMPGNGSYGGNGAGGHSTTATVNTKKSGKEDPMLKVLKAKMLPEQETSQPESGLLIFNLEKQRLKDLELDYTTPDGPLKIRFK